MTYYMHGSGLRFGTKGRPVHRVVAGSFHRQGYWHRRFHLAENVSENPEWWIVLLKCLGYTGIWAILGHPLRNHPPRFLWVTFLTFYLTNLRRLYLLLESEIYRLTLFRAGLMQQCKSLGDTTIVRPISHWQACIVLRSCTLIFVSVQPISMAMIVLRVVSLSQLERDIENVLMSANFCIHWQELVERRLVCK